MSHEPSLASGLPCANLLDARSSLVKAGQTTLSLSLLQSVSAFASWILQPNQGQSRLIKVKNLPKRRGLPPVSVFGLLLVLAIIGRCHAGEADDWRDKMAHIVPRSYLCRHTDTPIVVDGKLDDAAWADALWTTDFVDIQDSARPKPRFRTRAKMLWDDDYLYIAAELEEPHVWATLTSTTLLFSTIPISRCLSIPRAIRTTTTSSR